MRPVLVGLMYILSFVFAVLLAVSMRKFLFNLIEPLIYSESPSAVLLNLPMNISSYIPLIIAGFFLNFINYFEMRLYIWNVIWSSIFGITIFNFLKIAFLYLAAIITFPSAKFYYFWESILLYIISGFLITIFSILIKKHEMDKKVTLIPSFLTIIWLILVGKLKLNSNFDYSTAVFSATLPSIIIFLKS
ncbi:MAG: hypothetical protein HY919_03045 [Elusimicrobia bacterium]|nr:hypothetical protein [Elusimicrobiota bacterium]